MIRAEGRALAALIALAVAVTLGLQLGLTMDAEGTDAFGALWSMLRGFTIVTSAAVGVVAAMLAMGFRPGVQLQGALLLSIGAVAAINHLILFAEAPAPAPGIGALTDEMLHSVIPALYAIFWLIFAPKEGLRYRFVPLWLTYPLAYCGYALVRGEMDGIYPYPFLDVSAEGIYTVAFNLVFLLFVLWLEGLMIVALGRLIRRL